MKHGPATDKMSLAELNAMIAERSKPENLPKWWYNETAQLGKIGTYTPKPKQKYGRKGRPKNRRK